MDSLNNNIEDSKDNNQNNKNNKKSNLNKLDLNELNQIIKKNNKSKKKKKHRSLSNTEHKMVTENNIKKSKSNYELNENKSRRQSRNVSNINIDNENNSNESETSSSPDVKSKTSSKSKHHSRHVSNSIIKNESNGSNESESSSPDIQTKTSSKSKSSSRRHSVCPNDSELGSPMSLSPKNFYTESEYCEEIPMGQVMVNSRSIPIGIETIDKERSRCCFGGGCISKCCVTEIEYNINNNRDSNVCISNDHNTSNQLTYNEEKEGCGCLKFLKSVFCCGK